MKRVLALAMVILALALVTGCAHDEPKTERTVRREEQRDRTIQRNREELPHDIEVFWLTDEPLHLNRHEGP